MSFLASFQQQKSCQCKSKCMCTLYAHILFSFIRIIIVFSRLVLTETGLNIIALQCFLPPLYFYCCGYSANLVTGWDRSHGLQALSHVWQLVKLSDALSWGPSTIGPSTVVDEDVKKPNKQASKPRITLKKFEYRKQLRNSWRLFRIDWKEFTIIQFNSFFFFLWSIH